MPLILNTWNVVHIYLSFTIFYFWLNDIQRLIGDKDILIDQNDLDLLRERLRASVYPTTVFLPVLCFKMPLKTEIKIGKNALEIHSFFLLKLAYFILKFEHFQLKLEKILFIFPFDNFINMILKCLNVQCGLLLS